MTKIPAKRFVLTLMVVLLWATLGLYGISKGSDLFGLAAYVGSISAPMGVFIYGETRRPSGHYNNE